MLFQHCDRCGRTYPRVFSHCSQCGGPLREFEVQGLQATTPSSNVKVGLGDLAKYPFLHEAGEYLSKFDLSIFDTPEMEWIVDRAATAVRRAMRGEVDSKRLDTDEEDLLSFLSSVLIVRTIDKHKVTNKFAMYHAQRTETFLVRDLISGRNDFILLRLFQELAGIKITYDSLREVYKVTIPDYLRMTSSIKEAHWKLINRPVDAGLVSLDVEEAVRLVREVVIQLIKSRLAAMRLPVIPEGIKLKVEELRAEFMQTLEYTTAYTEPGVYAPCIVKAIDMLSRGENLPNSGRFLLATYMLARGKSVDDIVDLFRNAPDFSEKITRYHVENLAKKSAGERMSCPGCAWVKNNHLCFADDNCSRVVNPLQYGRQLLKQNV